MDTKVLINNPEILYFSSFLTPFGYGYIAKSTQGVCQIAFPYSTENDIERLVQNNNLSRSMNGRIRINIQRYDSHLKYEIDLLQAYFKGKQVDFDFPLDLCSGTPFQIMVWNKLREIPYGECRSYKWVAEGIGNPRAARAVGMANNKNPLPPVIPCHRVIGSDGSLTGYASGLHIKKYLIEMEKGISNGNSPQNTRNKRK
ncbi:MAG: methylated-DNA--[protein]-cysteine S-methyltransferase [Candidatus Brocadiaceae bacterium]|uniref:methylated-DNA--[protein]-cysteine S-methyltransferase n=1 Tax=Candidatus Wunengus sp. YC61 TaxID=3367698 RepID=UPI00271F8BFF|nr:methylated-DNA--[protein]-cysteine S-methyltransferase [Candidatus Brocadiaceae bacterium]